MDDLQISPSPEERINTGESELCLQSSSSIVLGRAVLYWKESSITKSIQAMSFSQNKDRI